MTKTHFLTFLAKYSEGTFHTAADFDRKRLRRRGKRRLKAMDETNSSARESAPFLSKITDELIWPRETRANSAKYSEGSAPSTPRLL